MNTKIFLMMILGVILFTGCGNQDKPSAKITTETENTAQLPAIDISAEDFEKGKELFKSQCSSCHATHKELVGPAVAGSRQRWPNEADLYAFIRNAPAMVEKNEYAKKLWLEYNKTPMLPFPDLTDEEIKALLDYADADAVSKRK
jgi:mono/diheme cytochrome c family protein